MRLPPIRPWILALPLTRKLALIVGTASAAIFLAAAAVAVSDLISFERALTGDIAALSELVSADATAAVLFHDRDAAGESLAALKAEPNIVAAGVYTSDGARFASFLRAGAAKAALPDQAPPSGLRLEPGRNRLLLSRPMLRNGRRVGTLYLQSDLQKMRFRLKQLMTMLVLFLMGAVLLRRLLTAALARLITEPILELSLMAGKIAAGDLSVRARVRTQDEVGQLAADFNLMAEDLASFRTTLEEQVEARTWELIQSNKDLTTANTDLDAFSSSVAHDLRAPVRQILGYAELFIEDYGSRLDDEARRRLEKIQSGARHMGRLVDDLLNLSKVTRQPLALEVVPLAAFARKTIEELKTETEGRNVEWRIGALFDAKCDPALVQQVFVNLLSNALKYTRRCERTVIELGATTTVDGERAVFVRDNGVGFDMRYAGKLFGIFQRLHTEREFEGTGVGLATVWRILRKHGGRIWAEAEPDKGATFYFTLEAPPDIKGES